jgi:Mpv17 / PMP22 family
MRHILRTVPLAIVVSATRIVAWSSPIGASNQKHGIFHKTTVTFPSSKKSSLRLSSKADVKEPSLAGTDTVGSALVENVREESSNAYVDFAKNYPFVNNLLIATTKTAAADLLAQTFIAQTPLAEVDLQRSCLFCLFGCLYLGAFQYLYQVQVFKRIFDVDQFTSQSWSDKLQDVPGLKALGAQTGLDLTVLTLIYLPTFYIFKASVFSGSLDPSVWFSTGIDNYSANFSKDEADLIKVWLPADLVCFSVPLYLRLPVRHVVSFVWTAYLSFARGGH